MMRLKFVWVVTLCAIFGLCAPAAGADEKEAAAGLSEIVLLYHPACAPCRYEATILPDIAKQFPDTAFTLVVLREDGKKPKKPKMKRAANLQTRIASESADKVMIRYGNFWQALPYSVGIDTKGKACAHHLGVLDATTVGKWQKTC